MLKVKTNFGSGFASCQKSIEWFCLQTDWGSVRICPIRSHIRDVAFVNERKDLEENLNFRKLDSLQKHEDFEFEDNLMVRSDPSVARS